MELDEEQVERFVAAVEGIAHQLRNLGNGDASTPFGALEAHSKHMGEKVTELSDGINSGLLEVAEALGRIADAIEKVGTRSA